MRCEVYGLSRNQDLGPEGPVESAIAKRLGGAFATGTKIGAPSGKTRLDVPRQSARAKHEAHQLRLWPRAPAGDAASLRDSSYYDARSSAGSGSPAASASGSSAGASASTGSGSSSSAGSGSGSSA